MTRTCLLLTALSLPTMALADVPRTMPDQALQQLRSQLSPYKDINYALSHGYVMGSGCDVHPTLGVMGYHVINPTLTKFQGPAPDDGRMTGGSTYTQLDPPGVLLYVPDGKGGLKLAGIESLVFAKAWEEAGYKHPPKYRGREYNYMADNPATPQDEAHNFKPHYDLHIWLFEHNPAGLYAQWNPALSCEGAAHD